MAWTNKTKNATEWDDGIGFLLQEIGAYLLQENEGKIILQGSWDSKNNQDWSNLIKN